MRSCRRGVGGGRHHELEGLLFVQQNDGCIFLSGVLQQVVALYRLRDVLELNTPTKLKLEVRLVLE